MRAGRLAATLVAVPLAALVAAGCGSDRGSTRSGWAGPTAPAAALTAAPSGTPAATPSGRPPFGAVDPALLGVLPAAVDGIPIVESTDTEPSAVGDPAFRAVGSALAAGLAIDPESGEFVYAVVVRLKGGTLGDAAFRDWRDTFDAGACSQAGGVVGNAEATIAGRTVYIGSCSGGLHTYHLLLPSRGLLISASSVGPRRLGERLVENLRP